MISKKTEDGIYECISRFSEDWYKDIYPGLWYGVGFNFEDDTAIVEDITGNRWFYIPIQDFLEHFKKVKQERIDEE